MVAARQNNNMKRKNGKPGPNNMRKNFKPGGGQLQQQQQQHNGGFKQQIRSNNGNVRGNNMNRMMNVNFNPMFTPNQMNDPGYMDFNEPSVRQFPPKNNSYQKNANNVNPMNGMNGQNGGGGGGGGGGGAPGVGNKSNNNNKNRGRMNFNKQRNNMGMMPNNGNNMGNSANGRMGNGRNFPMNGIGGTNNGPFRNGPPRIPFNDGPMGGGIGGGAGMRPNDNFGGPQFFPPQRFGPMMPPQMGMRPPIGMMAGRRRPMPPMVPAQMLPPFRGGNNGRPMRRKIGNGAPPAPNANNPRRPPNPNQKGVKNRRKNDRKGTKKMNLNVDKYPLTKPWVTDEIKAAHDKKVELSNQLKGKKDDQLFAEFKIQRDAFVKLYEAARDAYNAANKKQVIYSTHFIYFFLMTFFISMPIFYVRESRVRVELI